MAGIVKSTPQKAQHSQWTKASQNMSPVSLSPLPQGFFYGASCLVPIRSNNEFCILPNLPDTFQLKVNSTTRSKANAIWIVNVPQS